MDGLYKLKDMLCDELDEYGKKGELSAGALEIVDKLSHALKSISTVIAMEEGGYSEAYPMSQDSSYNRRSSYRGSYGSSYARRDSRGRYSREDGYSGAMEDMVDQLEEMKQTAPDPETKKEIQRLIQKFRRG